MSGRGSLVRTIAVLLACAAPSDLPALDTGKSLAQYSHVAWQEKNGLPSDMVSAVVQTRDGYLWFGTLNGLARFDGVRFTAFDPMNADAPLLHRVYSLHESRDGSLWAGSRGGLTRYAGGRFESYPMPEGFRRSGIRSIVEDAEGRVWVRTMTDLFRLRDGRLELFARDVRSVRARADGGLWVTTPDGISRVEPEGFAPERAAPLVPGRARPFGEIAAVAEGGDGTRWFGAPWGLGRLSARGEWRLFTTRDGLPANSVTALSLDGDGTLWVGTTGGLTRFRGDAHVADPAPHELAGQRILAIHEDRDRVLWVGTDTGGVHQLWDGLFTPLSTGDGLSDDLVMPILETRDGALWIGTARGLNRQQNGRLTTFTTRDGLADDGVFALAEDRDGRLWIGCDRGPLSYYEGGRFHAFTAPGLPARLGRVIALYAGRDGVLWIGTDVNGLYRLANGTARHYTRQQGLSDDHVARFHQRPDGSVWIATDQGLTRWEDGRLTVYGIRDGIPSPQVRTFFEDDGALWIGTYGGGLCRFRQGRFEPLPPGAGLPDTVVYEILEDERHDLWMTSNRGVMHVPLGALRRLMEGRPASSPFTLYDIGDGLKSSTCVGNFQPAAWKTRDGRLWFPTRRGAAWVDPSRPASVHAAPASLIERVLLDGRPSPAVPRAVSDPGRGNLGVEYTAPSFRTAARLRFRYRLDGFDGDWVDAGTRRSAYYTNLAPGHYAFRVAAATPDGQIGPESAPLLVEIPPHFYQTSAFYAACAGAVLLAIGGAFRLRVGQVRSRFALVLSERNRIARDMHDSLEQGLAAVALQLELCAKMNENGSAGSVLQQRLDLTRDVLEHARAEAKRSIADLRSRDLESGDLVTALSKVAGQFSTGTALKIDVSVSGRTRPLAGVIENDLLRICQEAVANAVRHGQALAVTIDLTFASDRVRLVVIDDGRGFDVERAVSARDGHFGLMGMHERAKKLGGRLQLQSTPGRGTEVQVEIPVSG